MKKLLLVLFILPFITSCDKKNNTPPKTKTQLIAQGTWRFSAATVSGSDVSALLQPCQKDNTMTFSESGSGNINEGPTKCNVGDNQDNPFTWSWQSGETILQVSAIFFTGGSNTFTLVSLTEAQLVLSQVITVGGSPQTAVVTFIH